MTQTTPTLELDDVLDQFFYASETPSRKLLHKLMEQYPQYSQELADFALHWSVTEPTDDSILIGRDVSKETLLSTRSKVLNALYLNSKEKVQASNVDNITVDKVSSLLKNIKGKKALIALSKSAGLGDNTILLGKLLTSSIIDPPKYVIDQISSYIDVPSELVAQYVIRPEPQAILRHFSTKGKPKVGGKETWVEAINNLVAPEEEKNRLLALN